MDPVNASAKFAVRSFTPNLGGKQRP